MNNLYTMMPQVSLKLRKSLAFFALIFTLGITSNLSAQQPGALGTNGFLGVFNCTALTDLGAFRQARLQATASGTGTWEFPLSCAYPGDIWRPYGGGTGAVTYNTQIAPVGGTGSALYNGGNGGASGNASSIVSGRYYTFNIQEVTSPANANMAILETNYNPQAILVVANSAAINGVATTVGVTLSGSPSAGENVFVRYSTDGFASSTLAPVTFSGATGFATIPAFTTGTVVQYYVLSSPVTPTHTTADMLTLNLNNFGGANYSFTVSSNPVTVSSSGGTLSASYATLAAAITAINTGVHTGIIVATVVDGYSETAPAGGYSITATGTAVTPITFQKSGLGAKPTFTASNALTSGALTDAIFKIIGGDYITISGFTMQENALNLTTAAATNNMTEWGVALLYASATNGAQNNIIQNCTISLNRTYTNTFGIYSNTRHSSTAVTTTADVTSTAGSNSNNKIYGNTISNVNMGIAFIGSGTAAFQDTGNDIGGASAATGNTISNWGGAAAVSGYISNSGTSYCIFMNHQVGDNVSYNTLTSASISGTTVTLRGIFKDYTSTGATLVGSSTYTNNTVTITDGFTSGTLECMRSQGTVATTSTMSLNNNTILNTTVTGASSSTTIVGIVNSSAWGTLNMNSNIIQGTTSTATTGGFTGVSNTGAIVTTLNMNSNQIGNATGNAITFSAATSGSVLGINTTGGASTCTTTIQSNDIRGIVHSVAGSSSHTYIINSGTSLSQNISSNTFTNLNVNTTGSVTFISNSVSAPSTGSKTVNSNSIVTAFNKGGAGGTIALYTDGGSSTATAGIQNNNNNFSNITVTGATTITGWFNNDGTGGTPTKTMTGNTFNNWTCGTSSVIVLQSNFGNPGSISNNTITNITGQSSITGLQIGSSGTVSAMNVATNTITSLSSTGTGGAVTGISNAISSTTLANINGNTINNLSSTSTTATVAGITTSNSANIFSNTINTLSCVGTTSGVANGIMVTAGATINVYKNKIYDIITSGAFATTGVNGIVLSGSTSAATVSVYNNLIGDLRATTASSTDAIRGISITATGTTSTYNIYYNSINIAAISSGVNFGTSGVFHAASTTSTTAALNLRNNIIVNASTPAGTGLTVAYRRSAGAASNLANYVSTSNNNLFYAGTPGVSNLIYSDGTSSAQTIATYKAGVFTAGTISPRDASSVTENPTWQSTSGASANFLKYNTVTATQIESGGAAIAGITDDFTGTTRNVTTPDIGAWELSGTPADFTGPTISYTLIPNSPVAGTQSFSSVTITDASGVNGTVGTRPRVYYKLTSNTNTFNDNTSATDGWKFVEASGATSPFSFTIDYSLLFGGAGVAAGNVVQYFVVAQDNAGTPNIGINSGTFTAAPSSVALTAAAFPITGSINQFNIVGTLSGTYTVCTSGCDYASLTNAAGAFADINSKVVTGNITLNITGDLTAETGANALNEFASPYTIAIQPSGAPRAITGTSATGLITLNGADNVTINGSLSATANTVCPASAASRDLTITNTNVGTASAVVWLQNTATPNGATGNTVKNCNIVGSGVTQTLFGIGSGSSTIGTASLGNGNNNNSIVNNNISGVQYGIYTQGASGANKNSGNTINQNIITTSANTKGGIWTGFENNITISGNNVSNIAQTSSPDVFGITCGFGTSMSATTSAGNEVTNATISNNTIGSVVNSGTFSAYGIGVSAATSGTTTIANNMVYGVSGNGTSGDFSAGIVLGGGTGSTTNVYYNSVSMNGTITGATAASQASVCLAVTASTAPTLDLRNNIFSNTQLGNASATLRFESIGLGYSSTLGNYSGLTSNNNDLYCTGAGPGTYQVASTGGIVAGTVRTARTDWTTETGRDGASQSSDPKFISSTNLHISTVLTTFVESNGTPIAVTSDFDCDTRSATTPDIGADEGTFVAPVANDMQATAFISPLSGGSVVTGASFTPQASFTNNGTATQTSVTVRYRIVDATLTEVYNNTQVIASIATGVTTTVSFASTSLAAAGAYTIFAKAELAGDAVTGNDQINGTLNAEAPLCGTYAIGASQPLGFQNLTQALVKLNGLGVSCAVNFVLQNDYTSTTETFPITINPFTGASATNTLTIKPASGVTSTISGSISSSIIILNGADYVTIDGSNAGAADRSLTIQNTNTGASSTCVWMQTTAGLDAATNNTIKNCVITGSGVTQTLFGIGSGSATISTSSLGTGNNSNTINNNNISGVQYGIYTQGASAASKNTGNTINQNLINTSANTKGGIWTGFENNITISGNTISNIAQTSSPDVFGITCGYGTSMSATTTTGNEVTNATITNNTIGSVVNSGTFSAYGIGVSSATSGTTLIANNMVYGVAANGTSGDFAGGIVLGGGTGSTTNVYYNSVSMSGTITGATAASQTSACLAVTNSTAPTLDIRNNIFYNVQLGNTGATIKFASVALGYSSTVGNYSGLTSNNNDLFCAGAGPGTYQVGLTAGVVGTARVTKADWTAETGRDGASSISISPNFISTTNLHINTAVLSPVDNTGTPIAGVTTDFDGDARSATTPDMGLDEMNSCANITYYQDADGDTYGNPAVTTIYCGGPTPVGYVLNNTDCNDAVAAINPTTIWYLDADGDLYYTGAGTTSCTSPGAGYAYTGLTAGGDCNDAVAAINPGATEVCNGIDDNCAGGVDDGLTFLNYYTDADGDGYGDATASPVNACSPVAGSVTDNTDCNDTVAAINPGATEVCNGIDDNCAGGVDDGLTFLNYYTDADGDGFGDATASPVNACSPVAGSVTDNTDCNDAVAAINPGATEVCNGIDDNCAGGIDDGLTFTTYYADAEGDGFGDAGSTISSCLASPPAGYVANSIDCQPLFITYTDADGDGFGFGAPVPCGPVINNIDCDDTQLLYQDSDGDGYGAGPAVECGVPTNTDCAPFNAAIHPGAIEACNGVDDDCNGFIDDGLLVTYYADADGDGYGDPAVTTLSCTGVPSGYVANNSDCNDSNAAINPTTVWYLDADADLYYTGTGTTSCTSPGANYYYTGLTGGGDCNDAVAAINPGATEICNGIDDNCAGGVDDGLTFLNYYTDADGDGFGDATASPVNACSPVAGSVTDNTDCNDAVSAINPGATEICNGIDDNCTGGVDDGLTFLNYYTDADGDGFGSSGASPVSSCSPVAGSVTNNTDCNDANAAINPSAAEVCNGVDDNCNGLTDDGLTFVTYYQDADGDGFGNNAVSTSTCSGAPTGYVLNNSDCNDAAFTYGDADGDGFGFGPAIACGVTNNLDCNDAAATYVDADGDGFGFGDMVPCGAVTNNVDCNDALITYVDYDGDGFGFGSPDACGSVTNNLDCNDALTTYTDADGDGFGVLPNVPCGSVTNNTDCNDASFTYADADGDGFGFGAAIACGAVTNNADCNDAMILYTDGDGDGHGAGAMAACGVASNDDCDDAEPLAYPGNIEVCDGIDNDCDGEYDEGTVTATVTPGGTVTACKGVGIDLQANAGVGYTYQWFKNGNLILGATGVVYNADKPGNYQVQVNIPAGCFALSSATLVTMNPAPNANISAPNGTSLCTTVKLKASYDASYTWQWKNGIVNVPGATAYLYLPATPGNYSCYITNAYGCSRTTSAITVTACKEGENVEAVAAETMDLYPNPTASEFTVELSTNSTAQEATLEVLNIVGEQVLNEKVSMNNGEINTQVSLNDAVPAGLYVVKVVVDNKEYTKQLVIQK